MAAVTGEEQAEARHGRQVFGNKQAITAGQRQRQNVQEAGRRPPLKQKKGRLACRRNRIAPTRREWRRVFPPRRSSVNARALQGVPAYITAHIQACIAWPAGPPAGAYKWRQPAA